MNMTVNPRDLLAAKADRLAAINDMVKALETEAREIKDALIADGALVYIGDTHKAVVTFPERSTLDMKAVRAHLSHQFITAHTTTKIVPTVTVRLRNAAAA